MKISTKGRYALRLMLDLALQDAGENIIGSHMWPLNIRNIPRSREAILVCIVDKICAVQERCGKVRIGVTGL